MLTLARQFHGSERPAQLVLIIGLLAANLLASADTLTVPNEFAPGTPARSADVNENFAAVETAVNDNDSRITANTAAIAQGAAVLVYDGAGNSLGVLVNIADDECCISIATPEGYIFSVNLADGSAAGTSTSAGQLYFESTNCTGTAYHHEPAGFLSRLYDLSGILRWYYSDRESIAVSNITMNSASSQAGCVPLDFPFAFEFVWPATLNDPAVTGVSALSYSVPIKFQRP
jgi:hypothetical protein